MITGLTQKVLDCQNSGLEEKKVIDEIARIVYWYPPMRRQWNPDECGDFLCHFYPRILPMIRRYRYQGKPFECLLKVTLKFQMKSFAFRLRKRRITGGLLTDENYAAAGQYWEAGEEGFAAGEEIIPYQSPGEMTLPIEIKRRLNINSQGFIGDPSVRRRFIMLILREGDALRGDLLNRLFFLARCDPGFIEDKLFLLRRMNFQREQRRETVRRRRNTALFNIFFLEKEMAVCSDPDLWKVLALKHKQERSIFVRMERILFRIPTGPTHRQIAEVLGIPKGTVDSGLYSISRRLSGAAGPGSPAFRKDCPALPAPEPSVLSYTEVGITTDDTDRYGQRKGVDNEVKSS